MSDKNLGTLASPPEGFWLVKRVRIGDVWRETWAKGSMFSPGHRWCTVLREVK